MNDLKLLVTLSDKKLLQTLVLGKRHMRPFIKDDHLDVEMTRYGPT